MKIRCVWEHNNNDSILYSDNFVGAFTRGETREAAMQKMSSEIIAYLTWRGKPIPDSLDPVIVQEKESELAISDADSDVIFNEEKKPLSGSEYEELKVDVIPDKNKSCLSVRSTFYGPVPRTAFEMYEHTKNVNAYYFGEIGVEADNEGNIVECRGNNIPNVFHFML
ncbi:MAG: hypothetical protein K2K63_16890 [Acetatifactor sp.]|nr:hypothetical protein [Acetatifactor sp.]